MNVLAWLGRLFEPKPAPPPKPPVPADQEPGIVGEILRMGEAAAGDR